MYFTLGKLQLVLTACCLIFFSVSEAKGGISKYKDQACDGCQITNVQVTTCPNTKNFLNIKLNDVKFLNNCSVVKDGCITYKKQITETKMTITNFKNPVMPFYQPGTIDLCNMSPANKAMLESLFGIGDCPASPRPKCEYDYTPVNTGAGAHIKKVKGTTSGTAHMNHGNGLQSCYNFAITIGCK